MLALLGYIAGIFSIICYVPYIFDVVKGKTKPERASWLIWMVLDAIAFFSQLAKGATDSLWLTGVNTLGVTIVFFLALKLGVGGLTNKDVLSLFASAIGLMLWFFFKDAAIALYLVICIEFIGALLTIQKSYDAPESETLSTWIIASIGGLVGTCAVGKFDIVLVSYPISIVLINGIIAITIILGKLKKNHKYLNLAFLNTI